MSSFLLDPDALELKIFEQYRQLCSVLDEEERLRSVLKETASNLTASLEAFSSLNDETFTLPRYEEFVRGRK